VEARVEREAPGDWEGPVALAALVDRPEPAALAALRDQREPAALPARVDRPERAALPVRVEQRGAQAPVGRQEPAVRSAAKAAAGARQAAL
jgi:hypothetical protein